MSCCDLAVTRTCRRIGGALVVLALAAALGEVAQAQTITTTSSRSVGGVSINAQGVLSNPSVDEKGRLQRVLQESLQEVPAGMKAANAERKISLARLEAAIQKCAADGKPLPDDMQYLAGLQQIHYVLVYPEKKDIILVGKGEGWKLDAQGNMVGVTTGRPTMLLDDLLVALRAALQPNRSVISCSIDPTDEGLVRVGRVASKLSAADPEGAARIVEEQLGPQKITFTGVPETSRFARVLVSADYRMKRISMGLEAAPIQGLPSFLQMGKAGGAPRNMLPRWWLAPQYEPLVRDADGLAWEFRGAGVKAMAENDFFNARGQREKTTKADPISQRWADQMTRRYEELSKAEPIFGELRNCMDLAMVGALIAKENLIGKAGCPLPTLTDSASLQTVKLPAPKHIESKAAMVKKGKWMIAAGGVEINPWDVLDKTQQSSQLGAVRAKADTSKNVAWWWD